MTAQSLKGRKILVTAYDLEQNEHRGIAHKEYLAKVDAIWSFSGQNGPACFTSRNTVRTDRVSVRTNVLFSPFFIQDFCELFHARRLCWC